MKNKKIILGLGTITALGAMSMGFVACVKEKDLAKYVKKDEVLKVIEEQKFLKDVKAALTGTADYDKLNFSATEWDSTSTLKKLVDEVNKLLNDKDLEVDTTGLTLTTKLTGEKHKLIIKKKNVDVSKAENSHLKVEKEFKFKIKSS